MDPVFGGFDEFGARGALEPDTLTLEPPGVAGGYVGGAAWRARTGGRRTDQLASGQP